MRLVPIVDFDDTSYDPFSQDEAIFGDIEDIHSVLAAHRVRAQASAHAARLGDGPEFRQDNRSSRC